ncbi:hypothetical protein H2200_001829 [Cladophialophora chaetospira]|uniref:Glycosyltransferase family 25 protein n=1 Tax=Cladophialophora chaetospira TaxID=386627 RepID=A0AA38XLM3_9EURO|nr:hypothetical protein H2200_001829 [Cladophialophora chaetospira]
MPRPLSWTQSRLYTRYRLHILAAVLLLITLVWLLPTPAKSFERGRRFFLSKSSPRQAAANSTLGFQQLLALSAKPSWRTRGLHAAAKQTGLNFYIPPQPHNPPEFVEAFEHIGAERNATLPKPGSAAAWVAHLDLIKFVIASGFETAFIIEDDVDWDLRIKSQMQLVSDNVRNFTNVPDTDPTPYGTAWDVLWLGHCGTKTADWVIPRHAFADDTRISTEKYSGWSKQFLRKYVQEGIRELQPSVTTVCTFGFGVTRRGAQKILDVVGIGADEAYDVALSTQCEKGELKCIVLNPQLMHHYEPPADHGYVSQVKSADYENQEGDESAFEFVKGTTGNIEQSARCKALFDSACVAGPWELEQHVERRRATDTLQGTASYL